MVIPHMAKGDFAEVQRKPEATASELKNSSDPERRRILLREMNRLVAEAERISSQPPKWTVSLGSLERRREGGHGIALHLG